MILIKYFIKKHKIYINCVQKPEHCMSDVYTKPHFISSSQRCECERNTGGCTYVTTNSVIRRRTMNPFCSGTVSELDP